MTILDEITGKEAYEMMLLKASNEEKVRRFFYRSDIWKAINEHIESDECCIIIKENPIVCHRGTGQAIGIRGYHTYGTQYEQEPVTWKARSFPAPVFNMDVEITYWHEEHEKEYDKTYHIQIPIELLTDFSTDKFNEWVKVKKTEIWNSTIKEKLKHIKHILQNVDKSMVHLILDELR